MTDKTRSADLVQAIECAGPGFTPELAKIARFALDHPEFFIRKTSREICAEPGTSELTLIRLCQQFGYAELSDFPTDLALALARTRPDGDIALTGTGEARADAVPHVLVGQIRAAQWSAERSLTAGDPFEGRNLSRIVSGEEPCPWQP